MDIVCFSHLRWHFVYQRPNHLMARAATRHSVHFVEEAQVEGRVARLDVTPRDGLTVITPILPHGLSAPAGVALQRELLDGYLESHGLSGACQWFYTPMALRWTSRTSPGVVIYDCMDELSAFKSAPAELRRLEGELLRRADLVFTGGRSLFEAKRHLHPQTHLFPSSVDAAHFARARQPQPEPPDQAGIGRPRVGYFGVIDERLDLALVRELAERRPEWQIVMVGPLAKLDESELPRAGNIHWLGLKSYAELPAYLAGWDVAMMPFAINEATRYISPTKTPEYLAGGRPVVSTPVRDVVQPYGEARLVSIAADAPAFVAAVEAALACDRPALLRRADQLLASQSWDLTWAEMERLALAVQRRKPAGYQRALPVPDPVATTRPADLGANLLSAASRPASPTGGGATAPRLPRARSR